MESLTESLTESLMEASTGLPTTGVPFLLLVAMAAMRCPYRIYFHLYCVGIQEFAILGVNGSAYALL